VGSICQQLPQGSFYGIQLWFISAERSALYSQIDRKADNKPAGTATL
jgi:hypothetical protein